MGGKNLAIVSDSGPFMPDHVRQAIIDLGVDYIQLPFKITFLEHMGIPLEDFKDKVDITQEEFFSKMADYFKKTKELPITSQPNPEEFKAAYNLAVERGADTVVAFTVTRVHSGSYLSAEAGALEVPEHNVTVIDSKTAEAGQTLQILAAAQTHADGGSIEDIIQSVAKTREETHLLLYVSDHKYLAERLDPAYKLLQQILKYTPSFELQEGKLEMIIKTRKPSIAREKMFERLAERIPYGSSFNAICMYTTDPSIAEGLQNTLREHWDVNDLPIIGGQNVPVGTAIGKYLGPKAGGIIIRHI